MEICSNLLMRNVINNQPEYFVSFDRKAHLPYRHDLQRPSPSSVMEIISTFLYETTDKQAPNFDSFQLL